MKLAHRVRRTAAIMAATAFVAFASQSYAQEISEAHMKAARAAIAAIKATDSYDMLLPAAAQILKQELIQQNPDLTDLISSTVDEKALALAPRRADLEREAALVYAKSFSEADLNAIAAFYSSAAGKAFIANAPIVAREVTKAVDIWQRGIQRDLATAVGESISKEVDAQVKAAKAVSDAVAPAPDGEAAAPEGEAPVLQGLDAPAQ
jgi:hypothetical protein